MFVNHFQQTVPSEIVDPSLGPAGVIEKQQIDLSVFGHQLFDIMVKIIQKIPALFGRGRMEDLVLDIEPLQLHGDIKGSVIELSV